MCFSTICLVPWCSKHVGVLKRKQSWGFLNANTIILFYKEQICVSESGNVLPNSTRQHSELLKTISFHKYQVIIPLLLFSPYVLSDSFVTPWTVAVQAPLPILEWIRISISRGSSQTKYLPCSPPLAEELLPLSHEGSPQEKFVVVQPLSHVPVFGTPWSVDVSISCPSLSLRICSDSCSLNQ